MALPSTTPTCLSAECFVQPAEPALGFLQVLDLNRLERHLSRMDRDHAQRLPRRFVHVQLRFR
jgi:hypothetical protein